MRIGIMITSIILSILCTQGLQANPTASTDKTLVSWATVKGSRPRGVSILTLQDGEQFDGIIINEEGNWIAGSDEMKRTESTEAAVSSGQMEQIAVVYKGSEISLYRDGKLITKYPAKNVDLLSSDNNFVVFGRIHYGGDSFITTEIEDARIYSQALSAEELNSLKPNQPSEIQPYAWWDFEGDDFHDRAGRFVDYNRGYVEGYDLQEGKLILHRWGKILSSSMGKDFSCQKICCQNASMAKRSTR
ncbi:MAG: LamG-like jellyroll fold domain-containing protein [Planctomycetota bacterium]